MNDINSKLTQIDQVSHIKSTPGKDKPGKTSDGFFNKILVDQLEKDLHKIDSDRPHGLPEIQGTFKARHLDPISSIQAQLGQKLTDSLDLFERYASFLGDPDKSLKQTHDILQQVLSKTGALANEINQQAGSKTDQVSDLKNILAQLMTTVRVEQIKFDRGDYL